MIREPDIDLTVTMPWPTICALACKARIQGCSLGQLVIEALEARLARSGA
jgi:predicted HicB family RNase H-like nuclease